MKVHFTIIGFTTVAMFAVMALVFACTKPKVVNNGTFINPCDNVTCINGGTCVTGTCACPNGYEGVQCELLWNARYNGNYLANNLCTNTSYTINVAPVVGTASKIKISNLLPLSTNIVFDGNLVVNKSNAQIAPTQINDSVWVSAILSQSENKEYINAAILGRDSVNHVSVTCNVVMAIIK